MGQLTLAATNDLASRLHGREQLAGDALPESERSACVRRRDGATLLEEAHDDLLAVRAGVSAPVSDCRPATRSPLVSGTTRLRLDAKGFELGFDHGRSDREL